MRIDPSRGLHLFSAKLKKARKTVVPKVADRLRREKDEQRN